MKHERAETTDAVSAGLEAKIGFGETARGGGVFTVQCFDANGNLKWEDSMHNLVVNAGLQDMNTKYFTGSGYTATFYLGLVNGPASSTNYVATDTLASHPGWTEYVNYSGARKTVSFSAATSADPSVISNSATPAQFSITGAGGIVAGAFLCTVASGTSGLLFSEADFQSPGDRTVASGDTLNVTYTFSLDAA